MIEWFRCRLVDLAFIGIILYIMLALIGLFFYLPWLVLAGILSVLH